MTAPNLRRASLADVGMMLDWAAEEGWNPGLDDAAAFYSADPQGFFIAEMAGQPVAAISVVNHSDDFAFLGLYICRPGFRGQGIGLKLWTHACAHAGGRTIGLDGVAAQEPNYAKSGFVRTGATIRFEGVLTPRADARVTPADPKDADALNSLDQTANGFARPAFLLSWLTATQNRLTLVLRSDDRISGFATFRRCREGVKIGPVIAQDTKDALVLARAGIERIPAAKTIIDLPSENAGLREALTAEGFAETFATARMYRGTAPCPTAALQAIATMELG